MAADIFSSFIGMTLQQTGNNNNAWGTILNGSGLQTLEKAIAGNISRAVTGGTLDLSANPPPAAQTQVLEMFQAFTGVLTANQLVKIPNVSKFWLIANQTSGAFQLLLQIGAGTIVNIPQGTTKMVYCDGAGNLSRLDKDDVGTFVYSGNYVSGAIQCAGQSMLKTDYPDLYAKIGTTFGSVDSLHFTIPNLTDTGRFLRSVSASVVNGTYQANQNAAHTHAGASFSGSTGTESVGHTHAYSGTTGGMNANNPHSHGVTGGIYGGAQSSLSDGANRGTPIATTLISISATDINHGHAYSGNTGTDSVDHTHAYSGTTGTIPSSGGSEARPEALSVFISIKY